MSNHPEDDHFHYGCFPPRARRSPAGGANNNNGGRRGGLFHIGQGGRTVLPPLHLPFRTSRSPAPDPSFSTNPYTQQDPSQNRNDFNVQSYGQPGWPVNATSQSASFAPDPRYPQQQQQPYGSYSNRAPSAMLADPQDSRTLPPLINTPQAQMHSGLNPSMGGPSVRSPTAGYPIPYSSYAEQVPQQSSFYPPAPDPRNPPVSPMAFGPSSGVMPARRPSMSVDRTVPSRMSAHGTSPYPRNPPMIPPSTYAHEQPAAESAIKKKRKRADAEQLKVLNETYNRTAFPSTEERVELAKKLGMSARSVQIWFQNKRQSMRQSTRQASTSGPPTTTEPARASSRASVHAAPPPGYAGHPAGTMGSPSQMYGLPPSGDLSHHHTGHLIPSPPPGHRGRSHEEEDQDPRRYGGRSY